MTHELLPEFNISLYHDSILEGYKYFHFRKYNGYLVVEPVRFALNSVNSFSLHVSDQQAKDLACGLGEERIYFKKIK
jgi:hypothetical protein